MSDVRDERRRSALGVVAPGTELRDGLERIVRGNTGALIVLGYDPVVRGLCSGGFELSAEFSATRLRELAKMDGAIVLDGDGGTILRAGVQRRIAEAERMGFRRAIVPAGSDFTPVSSAREPGSQIEIRQAADIRAAIAAAIGG